MGRSHRNNVGGILYEIISIRNDQRVHGKMRKNAKVIRPSKKKTKFTKKITREGNYLKWKMTPGILNKVNLKALSVIIL